MADPEGADDNIGAVVAQLADDAKAYGQAQVDFYKTVVGSRLRAARLGLILGALAVALATSALVVLLVGVVIALAKLVGPVAATAIVTLVIGIAAAVCGRVALRRIRRLFDPLP